MPAVLDDDDGGAQGSDDAAVLGPKSGPGVVEAPTLACGRHAGAGEAAAHDVDGLEVVGSDVADVFVTVCMGPVPFEDATTERIDFDLPEHTRVVERSLKAPVESTDPAEQRADRGHAASRTRRRITSLRDVRHIRMSLASLVLVASSTVTLSLIGAILVRAMRALYAYDFLLTTETGMRIVGVCP